MKKQIQVKKYMIIIVALFTLFGAIFTGVGVFSAVKSNEVKNDWQIIDAQITDFIISTHISSGKHHKRRTSKSTRVKYVFEGIEYDGVSDEYNSKWKKGDTIKIYCNPSNPEEIYGLRALQENAIVFTAIGVSVLTACIAISVKFFKGSRNKKQLLESGNRIQATIISYSYDDTISFNSKHPLRIFASYTDEKGFKHTVKSENIWEDADENIVGKTVTVYVDSENTLDYYVDADGLFNGKNEN